MRGIEQIPWLYDAMMTVMEPFGLGRWRRKLVAPAAGRTLEVGSGTGRNLAHYAAEVRLVALDLRLDLALAARRRRPGVALVIATAEALPFRDGAFETVVSSLVFCSVPDPHRGLRELGRVLQDGGLLRMLEHVRHRHPAAARLQDLTQPAWTWFTGGCHPNRETEAHVEAAGFAIDTATRRARGVMRLFSARLRGEE